MDKKNINILLDQGKGRAFCFLIEQGSEYAGLMDEICQSFDTKSRLLLLEIPKITSSNWKLISSAVLEKFIELKVRQVSLVGIDASTTIIQAIALEDLKLVRSLVLINATTKAHPTKFSTLIDRIEKWLPLGLPLRHDSINFNSKPFLQRLRCPILVLTTPDCSPYHKEEAQLMASRLPTAWFIQLGSQHIAETIRDQICEFENVPAKCPQKNRSAQLSRVG